MRRTNLFPVAGRLSLRTTNKAVLRLSEDRLIKVAAVLVGVTFLFTVAVLGFWSLQTRKSTRPTMGIQQPSRPQPMPPLSST